MTQPATQRPKVYRKGERKKVAVTEKVDLRHGLPKFAPQNPRLRDVFAEYMKDHSLTEAGVRAGYSRSYASHSLWKEFQRYPDYLTWMQAHYAQNVVKLIAIDQEQILQEIARIGMLNDYDYLVFEQDKAGAAVVRRKRLDELSREQMSAIEVRENAKGALTYKLRDKEGKLTELARAVGLLNEKIILEKRHLHLHAKLDFSKIPIEKLEAIEAEYEEVFADAGASRQLEARS